MEKEEEIEDAFQTYLISSLMDNCFREVHPQTKGAPYKFNEDDFIRGVNCFYKSSLAFSRIYEIYSRTLPKKEKGNENKKEQV